ncbi:MAG: hypothetical protein EBV63_00815 [Actinobacteria bacterium]|nr:hypothetical protein [Actinomycetota bacterium]NDE54051.1 hypothetical protein [Actinomycetota bacterium]
MAAKKKSAKRPVKKAAAKRPVKKVVRKSAKAAKRPAKKAPAKKAPAKKSSAKKSTAKRAVAKKTAKVDASKIVIPPVPSRGTTTVTSAPAATKPTAAPATPAKKNSNGVLFLVIAGVALLAIFALTNSSNKDDAAPKPAASESMSEEPTAEPSESASEEAGTGTYEAPQSFVAIRNSSGGVTLRWKAPAATEGLTGYAISVSYNAKDFTEVGTVAADQLNFDIALAGDEGGTQFLLQSVYSDGTKVDAKKFSLKGKYQN